MRAVVMLLRAQLRQHWKSWLALAALVTLVGGFVMAAAATARRTAAAVPDFVARHGYDTVVYSGRALPQLARFPQIAQVTTAPAPFVGALGCPRCGKINSSGGLDVFEVPPGVLARMVQLVSGRLPDQSDPGEVLASTTVARDSGTRVGSVIQVLTPTAAQVQLVQQGKVKPSALVREVPRHAVRMVGLVVTETELPYGIGLRYDLFATTALAAVVTGGRRCCRSISCGSGTARLTWPRSMASCGGCIRSEPTTWTPMLPRCSTPSRRRPSAGGCWPA